ncbi:MAG: hypothetical protein KDK70_43100, partial [Myxococcales bacterium]|nr:hypothetical protein [Myxococcales bacterium]
MPKPNPELDAALAAIPVPAPSRVASPRQPSADPIGPTGTEVMSRPSMGEPDHDDDAPTTLMAADRVPHGSPNIPAPPPFAGLSATHGAPLLTPTGHRDSEMVPVAPMRPAIERRRPPAASPSPGPRVATPPPASASAP